MSDAATIAALEQDIRTWFAEIAGTDSTGDPVVQLPSVRDVLVEIREHLELQSSVDVVTAMQECVARQEAEKQLATERAARERAEGERREKLAYIGKGLLEVREMVERNWENHLREVGIANAARDAANDRLAAAEARYQNLLNCVSGTIIGLRRWSSMNEPRVNKGRALAADELESNVTAAIKIAAELEAALTPTT